MKGNLVIQETGGDEYFYERSYVGIITEEVIGHSGDPIIRIFWFDTNQFMYYHIDKLDTESGNIKTISKATNESQRFSKIQEITVQ